MSDAQAPEKRRALVKEGKESKKESIEGDERHGEEKQDADHGEHHPIPCNGGARNAPERALWLGHWR